MRSRSLITLLLVGFFCACGGDAKTGAFMVAVKNGDLSGVKSSLSAGMDVNAKDTSGNAALHLAVIHDKLDVLKLLLDHHADVNIRARTGRTPLMLAAEHNRPQIVDKLIAQSADVNAKDENGDTATAIATRKEHYAVALLLKLAGGKE